MRSTGRVPRTRTTSRSTTQTGTLLTHGKFTRAITSDRLLTPNARKELQKLPASGRVKNIGVSNFAIKNLEKLLKDESCKTVPAVNQVELHPNNPSPKLLDYLKEKNIHATAYSCLGSTDSPLAKDATLAKIAKSKGKTTAQVL